MAEETEILIVDLDRAGSKSVAAELCSNPEIKVRVAEKSNLDGSSAGWLVLVAVTVKTLPAILDAIGRLIQVHRVKTLTLGNIVVENPSREDVNKLLSTHLPRD